VIWSTTEFGFLDLPDAFCTGSSIMPHKKNPGRAGADRRQVRAGHRGAAAVVPAGEGLCPLAYNRDLQEDKTAIFDAFDTVQGCLAVAAPLVSETKLRREAIAARLEDGFLDATTLMEALIARGVPMRSAHEAVGDLVRECEKRKCRLADLPDEMFPAPGVKDSLGVANTLAAFRSSGSTAPAEVERQLREWKERVS
jgi:argininosuccinate lyase